MQAHKALKALVLTFLLSIGALLPALSIPSAHGESTQGETTFYFTDALNISDLGFVSLSQNPPVKQNDSVYPPSLFIKNTSRFFPRYSSNIDQWITWFSTTWAFSFLEGIDDENLSDLLNIFGILPGPNRVVEGYTYTGNESVTINGAISFNLFFEQPDRERLDRLPAFKDSVKIALYSMNMYAFLPQLIKSTNITLETKGQPSIYKQQIVLPDISYTLTPGDSLLFSVEIVPSNKTFSNWITKHLDINKIISRWQNIANFLENRSKLPKIQNIGTAIKDLLSAVEELQINITSEDIASLYNSIVSSKLVYDSRSHPSSVTIPAKIIEDDIRDYFLHSNQEMSETRPAGTNTSKTRIDATQKIWATTQGLERNKILKVKDITAELYFYRFLCLFPGKVSVTVTVYDDNTTIASSEKVLTKKELQGFLRKKITPIIFTFSGIDREITYGHQLGFGVALSNGTKGVRTPLYLQYDSIDFSSFLRVKYEETNNIQIHDLTTSPSDGKIIPGGSVQFIFNVTSKKTDTLLISTIEREKTGTWNITLPPAVSVSANNSVKIPLYINSTNNRKEAYGNIIDLIVVVIGNTGIARYPVSAEISKDVIQYKVEILGYSPSINMKKGESHTFFFIIKNNNTGAIDDVDSYTVTATSEHDFPLIPRGNIRDVLRGGSTEPKTARVDIEVPKETTAKSDIITITVTSDSNSDTSATINITVNMVSGGFLEELYNIFDSAAKSLGLNEIFGSDGALVLAIILMIIIIFLLIILAFVLTTKPVRIICPDRIKEIESTEKAVYELSLQNPQKRQQSYDIYAKQTAPTNKWTINIEPLSVFIDGGRAQTVQVIATPTEFAEPSDWTQITVQVKKTGKKNTESITLMAMLKEGKTLLQLRDVSHWPTEFIPGEKVTTSFTILNNGTITARDVNVFFYLNGKQKNKLNVTIPAGGAADIQIPWIAIKGKNKVRIRLNER